MRLNGWQGLCAVLICMFVSMTSANAQDLPREHSIALTTYATAAALDYHSTYLVLSSPGGRENNPLGRLTRDHPVGTVALGAAVDIVATTLIYKWLGKKRPKLTTTLAYSVAAFRVSLAAHNYREFNRVQTLLR